MTNQKRNYLLAFLVVCFYILTMESCSRNRLGTYYQTFETRTSIESQKFLVTGMTFENPHLMITYNLWNNYGTSAFMIINQTDSTLFVDLDACYFVQNGVSFKYYVNQIQSYSASNSVSASNRTMSGSASSRQNSVGTYGSYGGFGSSVGTANQNTSMDVISSELDLTSSNTRTVVSYPERLVSIPPNTISSFSGYFLVSGLYYDCNMIMKPRGKEVSVKEFDSSNSPYNYRNIITYRFVESQVRTPEDNVFETSFWVSKISNYTRVNFVESHWLEECGKQTGVLMYTYPLFSPSRFYIKYNSIERR